MKPRTTLVPHSSDLALADKENRMELIVDRERFDAQDVRLPVYEMHLRH
jgi:hypothetical protein